MAIIISQENHIKNTMRNQKQLEDEEEFQVFLSRQDFRQLKSYKIAFEKQQNEFKAQKNKYQQERSVLAGQIELISAKYEQSQKHKQRMRKQIDSVYDLIKEKHSELAQTYETVASNLISKLKTKDQYYQGKPDEQKRKIVQIEQRIKHSFEIFSFALQKQHQKVANLIRDTIVLKQQNLAVKENAVQQGEKSYIKHAQQVQQLETQLKNTILKAQRQQAILRQEIQKQNSEFQVLRKRFMAMTEETAKLKQQNGILVMSNNQLIKENRQLQEEVKEYQEHISILKQSIKLQSRLKEASKRKTLPKTTKFEKEDYIKETLIDYMRQIRKNLISIGNLSQEEIRQIGTSELRTLVKFIQQLQEDFQ